MIQPDYSIIVFAKIIFTNLLILKIVDIQVENLASVGNWSSLQSR